MKKQFLRMVAFVLLMTMTLLLVSCGKEETSAVPEEDGSDKNTTVVDAPKTMESTEITAFDCTFSTLDMDEGDLSGHVYTLQASLQAGTVNGGITVRDQDGNNENNVFTADAVFMQQLQSIVKDHALASHNGLRHQVSGLPDTYGAELCVTYASGEEISAGDNQDNFLSPAAMRALVELFSGAVVPEQSPDAPAEKPEEYPLVFGMYRGLEPDADGLDVWMELIEFPEFLLLEFHHTIDGSVVVFRAEEFWPDDPCEVIWTAAQLTGKIQEFSMIQQEVGYYGMPRDCELEPTENGLVVKYEDGEELTFVLDNSFCGHTTQEEQLQIMWENYEMTYIEMELVGPWMNWDDGRAIRISLDGDGAFRMLYKEPGYPVRALRGVWGVGLDSGDLLAMADTLFAHPLVKAFTNWEFTDEAWLGAPAGLVRRDGSRKPAYEALKQRICRDWHTKVSLMTDENGQCTVEGFRGEYALTCGGRKAAFTLGDAAQQQLSVV